MAEVLELQQAGWDEAIGSGVTLVDFWAPWCGPCMLQGPIVDEVAEKVSGVAKVAKLNVDEAQGIAATYGIRSIPTLIVFKDGEPVQQLVGLQSETQLVDALKQAV